MEIGSDLLGICAELVFTSDGYVLGSCLNLNSVTLFLFDPDTLDIVAKKKIVDRPPIQGPAGGAQFSYDASGRIYVGLPTTPSRCGESMSPKRSRVCAANVL